MVQHYRFDKTVTANRLNDIQEATHAVLCGQGEEGMQSVSCHLLCRVLAVVKTNTVNPGAKLSCTFPLYTCNPSAV